jgi:DNA-binding response OmpR family regulator
LKRVLIVDDDILTRELLEMSLARDEQYTIASAHDLQSARTALQEQPFDLVLLDLNLPDGNGFDMINHIRKVLKQDTPVIILTANHQEITVLRGFQMGAEDYINKPFSLREVHLRIEKVLKNR